MNDQVDPNAPHAPTFEEALSARVAQAKAELQALKDDAAAKIAAAETKVSEMEAELVGLPAHLKVLIYDDFVKKVADWFSAKL